MVLQPGNIPGTEVIVSDTGHGIPADHLPKIFDPFFTTSDRVEGTGLGLSLTRKMVKEHGETWKWLQHSGRAPPFVSPCLPIRAGRLANRKNPSDRGA